MPAEQGLIPVPLRSPSPTLPPASDTDDGIGWIKPNRWEKEKASNQRLNMTRVLGNSQDGGGYPKNAISD